MGNVLMSTDKEESNVSFVEEGAFCVVSWKMDFMNGIRKPVFDFNLLH